MVYISIPETFVQNLIAQQYLFIYWHAASIFSFLISFRDGNGRTGRLLSNFILLRAGHPMLIIELKDSAAYIGALCQIRTEATDEHLVALFFKTTIERMQSEMAQKQRNAQPMIFF